MKIRLAIAGLCCAATLALTACSALPSDVVQETGSGRVIHATFATDISDPPKLAGLSSNVFVGRVVSSTSTRGDGTVPITTHSVVVRGDLKGSTPRTVIVNQEGGPDARGAMVMFEGDSLLEVGEDYILFTRKDRRQNLYVVVPIFGHIRLQPGSSGDEVTKARAAISAQIAPPFEDDLGE